MIAMNQSFYQILSRKSNGIELSPKIHSFPVKNPNSWCVKSLICCPVSRSNPSCWPHLCLLVYNPREYYKTIKYPMNIHHIHFICVYNCTYINIYVQYYISNVSIINPSYWSYEPAWPTFFDAPTVCKRRLTVPARYAESPAVHAGCGVLQLWKTRYTSHWTTFKWITLRENGNWIWFS